MLTLHLSQKQWSQAVGEPLQSDHQLYVHPCGDSTMEGSCPVSDSDRVIVSTALLARIEALESQNCVLTEKLQMATDQRAVFRLDDIARNDKLARLYTGFSSFGILRGFF